ncbi:phage gp6-like head-tail connector protein [Rhizobium sp. 16-449-1b]|uniref:head-tail connector protein n=1 Tax=Rhizobium sp. 16-449-1b TaxID=2819989 RepID=UPI001AD9812A|nr:head-tail connector protein [Rhizobium sp. 16-449-1b]MBO9194333.1 phage gp6-like head-tail connector protein [Rhizobium sp. 16-449-1b]
MSLRLVTPASATIVSLTEAKAHLRVFHEDDDDYIGGLIAAAQDWLAGEKNWLGRSVVEQGWELTLDHFPVARVDLPKPPLKSVDGVLYTPANGVEVTLSGFRVIDAEVADGGYILPAIGAGWPVTNGEPASVRIAFKAGFETVPTSVKQAALLMIGHWYEHREAASDTKITDLPMAVDALLYPYRNWAI